MGITERDKKRLDALIKKVKPSHSIAARLDTLSHDQRDQYDWCKSRLDQFFEQHSDGDAYEMYLKGFGPRLPHTISVALFGEIPRILKTDDDQRAQDIYRRYCDG